MMVRRSWVGAAEGATTVRSFGAGLVAAALVAAAGCGDDTSPPDAAHDAAAADRPGDGPSGTPDAPIDASTVDSAVDASADAPPGDAQTADAAPTSCDPERIVPLSIGSDGVTAVASGNTNAGLADLDPSATDCALPTGPEIVHRLVVPGAGPRWLTASTDDPATQADTVLYVRTQCASGGPADLGCNDDAPFACGTGVASRLGVAVEGGQEVFIVVDSYSGSAGAYRLTVRVVERLAQDASCDPSGLQNACSPPLVCSPITGGTPTCRSDTAPTLTTVEAFFADAAHTRAFVFASGSDPDGNVTRLQASFLDGSGSALGSVLVLADGAARSSFNALPVALDVPSGAAQVSVQVVDATGQTSSALETPLSTFRDRSQSCQVALAAPDECAHELVCDAGTCVTSSDAAGACAAAPLLNSSTVTDTVSATDPDRFEGSCVFLPGGGERVYRVHLASGTNDLVASTTSVSTTLDTYVYLRRDCGDPGTELACNDDGGGSPPLASHAEARDLAPGDYYVFVDGANGACRAGQFRLSVLVRPVVGAGSSCDPNGITSRCAGGLTCSGSPPTCG
jgi:hypothetical protein